MEKIRFYTSAQLFQYELNSNSDFVIVLSFDTPFFVQKSMNLKNALKWVQLTKSAANNLTFRTPYRSFVFDF